MNSILEIKNATKKFGGLIANDNITFSVQEGEIVGLVGPNGAGKTTLFNSVSGAHSLTSGQVVFNGEDITKKKPYEICKLGVGRTFQIPQSLNEMSVFENVLVAALNRHGSISVAKEHTQKVIAMCGLASFIYMHAGNLNVMQKKRLEIARALATEPKLLLLDETMAGLSGVERKEAINLIQRIKISGITILMIEHVMEVVMNVSDRVVVLTSGRLLAEGTPEEVTQNQQVINAYLGGMTN
ncbi:MAG: transporter ATP-binding protein [Herbinix sp.]|jgi:branched-chain amino acid transport system ATP-binding protein|nr:transporter ATP-binding protein [Herbinix sp.]